PSRRRIAATAAIGQIVLAVLLLCAVSGGDILVYALGDWPAPRGIVLVADRLAAWMVLTTALLALFALLYAGGGIDRDGRHFHVLFQMQLFGLSGAFLTGDLFNLFVFFEILLIASYGLLLHGGGAHRVRAGMHYVVLNLLGSTLFLFAAGLFYGVLGTLNFADLAVRIAATPPENLGLVRAAGLMLFGVFALKAALLPLHLWLPAAYASAAAPAAALFTIMTKVGAYSILRTHTLLFGPEAGPLADLFQPWLLPAALATLAFGMLGVLAATRLAQQAAYLVVASVGTLLIAFGLGSNDGIAAGLYYLPHSTFAVAALFLLSDAIARRRGASADFFKTADDIPRAGLWGGLFFFSAVLLAGLPPLSGFLGKFMILRAALAHPMLPWVWGVVLATALLGLIALARSGSRLFFLSHPDKTTAATPFSSMRHELVPIIGLLALAVGLTLWAGPASDFARAAATQLLQPTAYIGAVLGGPR
ncbi:MAG: monovalent cation/H+ antiporter subunit D, partial [Rhodocyclaceae bacterium]|nr:monovalent cation/H+ antiporter subunit D [Rhodocyclaceae bacterium]